MIFYSHSKKQNDIRVGSKVLFDHINGVKAKALKRFHPTAQLTYDEATIDKVIHLICQLHDLGKYTRYFQNYLLDQPPIHSQLKQHAKIGGVAAYQLYKEENEKLAMIILYIIVHHHANLSDVTTLAGKLQHDYINIFDKQVIDLFKNKDQISRELKFELNENVLSLPDDKVMRKAIKVWVRKEATIQDYYLINYLFSLLIEADKLDASDTLLYDLKEIEETCVDERFGDVHNVNTVSLQALDNNELRNYCRYQVTSHLSRPDILSIVVFTLTAPTGTGKTLTALDFALKLRKKISNENGYTPQIIYALPFINIIEQGLKEYEKTCPEEIRIMGHYQFADVFGKDKASEEDKVTNYNQKVMEVDTWQADVVITSFVQFFETLIGNRNKLLKKFNHLAGSIIILDEVQTLKLDQLPLIGAALHFLTKFLDARVIAMTATRPKLFELVQEVILDKEEEKVKPYELLENYEEVFQLFNRTCIKPIIEDDVTEDASSYFVEETFPNYWSEDYSCLIVCNTVKRSIEIFKKLSEDNNLDNPIYYLSTNIIPKHRMERIEQIKEDLKNGKKPILIATQVVEAGVDLDFDIGFRDIGPIDSIIQVAGRINRNNNPLKIESPLYVVDFGDCRKIYGMLTYQQAFNALKDRDFIKEPEYVDIVSGYFENLSERSAFDESEAIFKSMKMLKYDGEEDDHPVSSFKIIKESNATSAVYVELDEHAKKLRDMYLKKIYGDLTTEDFARNYKRAFHQHIITVPDVYYSNLPMLHDKEENVKYVQIEVLTEFYDFNTGFIRNLESKTLML